MKTKTIILVSFLFLTAIYSEAQTGIGLMVGPNISTQFGVSKNIDHVISPTGGLNIGVFFNIGNGVVAFSPGLSISQKGYKYVEGETGIVTLNYFELPLLVRLKLGEKKLSGFINIGPYLDFMMSGNVVIKDGSSKDKHIFDSDDYENINRIDVGLIVGGGVQYELGPGNLFVDIRFAPGFIDINKNWKDIKDYNSDYKHETNFSTAILFGYLFRLGK